MLADENNPSSDRPGAAGARQMHKLLVTLGYAENHVSLRWSPLDTDEVAGEVRITCVAIDVLEWELTMARQGAATTTSSIHLNSIRAKLRRLLSLFPTSPAHVTGVAIHWEQRGETVLKRPPQPFKPPPINPAAWIEAEIAHMGRNVGPKLAAAQSAPQPQRSWPDPDTETEHEAQFGRIGFLHDIERRAAQEAARREQARAQLEADRKRRQENQKQRELQRSLRNSAKALNQPRPVSDRLRAPLPPVPMRIEPPAFEFQEALLASPSLRDYLLRERAALWWVSNQADDLLALPYCNIQRLDYQIRTALRVIGPLRGRALLSDEVGLGKTIEAGLVLKEYLTRGMVKRFLVLTVPSLVDQWEEELADKFNLTVATTNHARFRASPSAFWQEEKGIVASVHTLKQPAHRAIAQTMNWDMLIVDEAHHLRNRASQAWDAVNALPRQFLLLLTATPVQNSLEELYNLVTLLQPGQLPSPKEFRQRFIDKDKPHQPREPEELRRLLGQVMIRNTRANAGIDLPPRRAETVLFEPTEAERVFWQDWEHELRLKLASMNASQSALWGRLLLQAGGSSPSAWRHALISFPDHDAAGAWSQKAPLEESWAKKCGAIVPLARGEGGVVIFTQFLHTQSALADSLEKARVPVFVVNGSVPAAERQPITDRFRKDGGALILTQSGTEGRNLQFCHRLVNFDLPWNPMEIEQRIGRLHRLGQQHPVRIFNLVQAGTLQEHLLNVLQEKLNLFELVVGETGLILGDRFGSDEFAEEVFRRWRDSEGRVAEAMQSLGEELAAARTQYGEVRELDESLFADDYESL